MSKFKILAVCGTGVATSTVAAEKCKEMLIKKGLDVDVTECKAIEVASKVDMFKPDVIVHTTPVSDEAAKGVKKFAGLPFLTGIGIDKLTDEIVVYLTNK